MANRTAWLIDHYASMRQCAAMALEDAGFEVKQFSDPFVASQALAGGGNPPDAVLCELFFYEGAMMDAIQFYSVMAPQLVNTAKFVYTGAQDLVKAGEMLGGLGARVMGKSGDMSELVETVRKGIAEMDGEQLP
jgi:DNA-binding NtrC family response regulator